MSGIDSINRRQFVQVLGAGILIAVAAPAMAADEPRGGGRRGGGGFRGNTKPIPIAARVHIGADGIITVMTGKVECGQGSRAEITQAAAEELRVAADAVQLVMADTELVPDDGMTAGSATTPRTLPAVRHGAAAARVALLAIAARMWGVDAKELEAKAGKVLYPSAKKEATYGVLAATDGAAGALAKLVANDVTLTSVKEWKVMGVPTPRPNAPDLVTGKHAYPSDIQRPGMLYGKVLRPPAYGAKLKSIDLSAAKAMQGVVAVQEGEFVGFAAPTRFEAEQALAAAAKTAQWEGGGGSTNNDDIYDYLPKHARGGVPSNPFREEMSKAAKTLKQQYHIAYIQHAPLEPRAAIAEWNDNKLTIWCGTQNPFGVKNEVARALNLSPADVRVIVPDVGGAFGGKHFDTGAVEAARLAKAAGKPVSYRWTRQEEFTWAYFRPAGVIFAEASLDSSNRLTSWHFINVNSGPSAVETSYKSGKTNCKYVPSESPLRPGSYRGLASTANTFAREVFMDELAILAGVDPLEFRRNHLGGKGDRLRAVLDLAAEKFGWANLRQRKGPAHLGIGLACGTEKGAYTAACAEVVCDPEKKSVRVHRVVQTFECGAVVNPSGLTLQIQGAIVQGLGAILREEIKFADGKVRSDTFAEYKVPRFADLPEIEVHLLDRKDLPSSGAGETPIIAIAPAVANAVFDAIGQRVRSMPMRLAQT